MQTLYKRLVRKKNKLSQLENKVLEFIIEHPEIIIKSTITEVSEFTYISTATISRTCKELGYSGYQELKYTLSHYLNKNNRNKPEISIQKFEKEEWFQRTEDEIMATLQYLRYIDLNTISEMIKKSHNVEFFGVGASYMSCLEAARRLTFSGKIASAREDWDELRLVAQNLTENDLAIIVSYSGETIHILEYATILQKNKVPILSITGDFPNSLEDMSTINCKVKIENCYYGEIDMCSRVPVNIILEYIVNYYTVEKK